MTNYKILFLDIDGTILKADHTIDHSTKNAIKQVKEQGIEIFLATGRPLHEVTDIADELDVHSFIGYNGAYAIYQDKEILNKPMKRDTVKHFLHVCQANPHEMVLYTHNKSLMTSLDSGVIKDFTSYFDLKDTSLFTSAEMDNVLGITLMNLEEDDPKLYETDEPIFFSQVNVEGLMHSYDIIRESVNKGRAIKHVIELLGFEKDSTIAFGDGMNDKQMLEFVGEGFAMGNAHPDLFAFAKHRTTSVDDNGIFNGLKQLGLVK
ncbi:HAD family hydrolase [Paraliobacillus sediminis]|uniref:HAD family hydrolase n=1 Tax=Paraliobacillus sediminis TaxID=1885916 RepID=UPI000E3BAC87|nr:HAD family hydrolase [Paraliobacillus sediminis]